MLTSKRMDAASLGLLIFKASVLVGGCAAVMLGAEVASSERVVPEPFPVVAAHVMSYDVYGSATGCACGWKIPPVDELDWGEGGLFRAEDKAYRHHLIDVGGRARWS